MKTIATYSNLYAGKIAKSLGVSMCDKTHMDNLTQAVSDLIIDYSMLHMRVLTTSEKNRGGESKVKIATELADIVKEMFLDLNGELNNEV